MIPSVDNLDTFHIFKSRNAVCSFEKIIVELQFHPLLLENLNHLSTSYENLTFDHLLSLFNELTTVDAIRK